MKKPSIVVWFSCGAASAVAAKLTVQKYGETHDIVIANNIVAEEDHDNLRFLQDVSTWIGLPIQSVTNPKFIDNSAEVVWDKMKYMSGIKGAPCTVHLKKEARKFYETTHSIDYHVFGFTFDEKSRHDRFVKFERSNVLPILIEAELTKEDCFDYLKLAGIKLPRIYSLGFPNANCIGCVKASSATYWNLVRKTHPEVFKSRSEQSEQSRRIGAKLAYYKGKRVYLDELPEEAKGRKIKSYECGIICETK